MYRNSRFCLLISICFLSIHVSSQIHVDLNAMGANNGSSWADAYTDLTVALNASNVGDAIWVAQGTYYPGNDMQVRDTFFTLPHDLELYGGFNGTESALDERDVELNKVILSADYLGNDIENNFTSNKEDNALRVMLVSEIITSNTIIDGFTFANGWTEGGSSSGNARRGGGILCYGSPKIRNCTFKQNFGWFGGGLYPRVSDAVATEISNCVFENNRAGFGGGLYINQDAVTMTDCTIMDNSAENSGGGIYNNSTDGRISSCTIVGNTATGSRGGGIYHESNDTPYTSCIFSDNTAGTSTGGAIHIASFDENFSWPLFEDCSFINCQANWGGAISIYNTNTTATLRNCVIQNNNAFANGGGFHTGFGGKVIAENCEVTSNTAVRGAAFNSQNDTSAVTVIESIINDNRGSNGGAFQLTSDDTVDTQLPLLTIDRSIISANFADVQGGAINILNADLSIDNSLIIENVNTSQTGAGGAISINAFSDRFIDAEIKNTSFYGNVAVSTIGGGIAHFTDATGVSVLSLQNNIFGGSLGMNYAIEDGNPTVESRGGNLSDDNSMSGFLIGTNDTNEEFPEFVDVGSLDFHLNSNSPAINTGIDQGASLVDIEGNPRQGTVDKGAYEYQGLVGLQEILDSKSQLKLFPNPAKESLSFQLDNNWTGKVMVQINDSSGRLKQQYQIGKSDTLFESQVALEGLEQGMYFLVVKSGDRTLRTRFFKIM